MHLMPDRVLVIQKIRHTGVHVGNREPLWAVGGIAVTMENSTGIPQKKKIKNRTTVWSSKLNSGNNENTKWKWYLHPQVHSSIVYHSHNITQCAIYSWVGTEMWCMYKGILLSDKQWGLLPSRTTWMDLEGVMLSKICQAEKDKYHVLSLICESKKQKQQRTTETVTEKECRLWFWWGQWSNWWGVKGHTVSYKWTLGGNYCLETVEHSVWYIWKLLKE